jgi:multicomponent Na+:H+ antiporter subunit E
MIRVVRVLWLLAVWLALWSDISVANVTSGLLVAVAVMATFRSWQVGRVIVRPLAAARFAAYFAYKLVESTVVVARAIAAPAHRIHTGIVAVPLQGCSDALVTLIAEAITLTPGTLTLEVSRDPLVLYVHALDLRDVDAVRADVRKLEMLAVRAFGDDEALRNLAVDTTESWRAR